MELNQVNLAPAEDQSASNDSSSIRTAPIIIRMWPKTPVLYPMAILALVCGIVGMLAGSSVHVNQMKQIVGDSAVVVQEQEAVSEEGATQTAPSTVDGAELEKTAVSFIDTLAVDRCLGSIFLLVMAFSLFTLCVDLEIRWALISFSVTIVIILSLILINQQYQILPAVFSTIFSLSPIANPQFYFAIFFIWVVLMILSLGVVRFHYVRIESNEVVVVGGLLEKQQRFPTLRMKYVKDIQDVLEYYLPGVNSGRLILTFPDQNETVIIDNVLGIDKVIKRLDKVAGVLNVHHTQG